MLCYYVELLNDPWNEFFTSCVAYIGSVLNFVCLDFFSFAMKIYQKYSLFIKLRIG